MRKIVLLISAIILTIGVSAQKGKVSSALSFIDQGALDKAKEAIDLALVNEKSKDWSKTYYALGRLAQASFESENPKFKSLYKEPLVEAYKAYEKAMELDPKGGTKKLLQVNSTYLILGNLFINDGVQNFTDQKFDAALQAFKNNIKIASSDVYIGLVDTGIIFNAGLAAYNAKKYDEAIELFEICTISKYENELPYQFIVQCYTDKGDLESAEKALNLSFETFPGNQEILLTMIQFYLDNDITEKAFKYIEVALADDPLNHALLLAEGFLYMKQEKYDLAVASLEKSISLNSEVFGSQLNLGICYYNQAFEKYLESNEIMDVKKYNEAVAEVDKMFEKALKPFEKAHELNPDDVDTMKNLKELYYRLKMTEKYDAISKKLDGKI
jgi:tetratricopeptide (TPR) repeat protein